MGFLLVSLQHHKKEVASKKTHRNGSSLSASCFVLCLPSWCGFPYSLRFDTTVVQGGFAQMLQEEKCLEGGILGMVLKQWLPRCSSWGRLKDFPQKWFDFLLFAFNTAFQKQLYFARRLGCFE